MKIYLFCFAEEILSGNSAVWFSPTASRLLYARFDDSMVGRVAFSEYVGGGGSGGGGNSNRVTTSFDAPTYPKTKEIRYPKVIKVNIMKNSCMFKV